MDAFLLDRLPASKDDDGDGRTTFSKSIDLAEGQEGLK